MEENLLVPIQDAVSELTGEAGLVLEYIVIASYIDERGDRQIYSETKEGQADHHSLGLLDWGLTYERAVVSHRSVRDYEEEGE